MADLQIRTPAESNAIEALDPPAPTLTIRKPDVSKALAIRPAAVAGPVIRKPDAPDPAVLSQVGSSIAAHAKQGMADTADYAKQNFKEGVKNITDPAPVSVPGNRGSYASGKLGEPEITNQPSQAAPLLTQLKRPLGALQAVTAPMYAAEHGFISKPIEEATGGKIKADWVDLARMGTPLGIAGAAGAVGRVAKATGLDTKIAKVTANPDHPLVKGAQAIQSIFSPTTMSKDSKAAEATVREARGLAERDTQRAQEQVNGIARDVNALPPQEQQDFVNYVETRSTGAKLKNPNLQKAADTIRDIYQGVRQRLETSPHTDQMGFVQDYFTHQWKDQKKAQAFIADWAGKTGSGKSLKKRSIPTIEDGIKAGLEPVHANPLDATMNYVGNMNNYLALKDIQQSLKDQKLRKFYPEGAQPAGWVELKGPGNRNLVAYPDKKTGNPRALTQVAYAPEDAARIYNRYYGAGFTGRTGDLYKGLRAMVNGPTQMILGLSGYHYRLITGEQMASAFSEAAGRLARGDIVGAGKSALKAIPYVGAVGAYRKGEKVAQQALGKANGMDQQITDYIARAGGRTSGIDKSLKSSESNNFWDAWKKGTLKAQAKADIAHIASSPNIATGAARTFGTFTKNVGKLMDTVAYPLFAKVIPNIKNSVVYDGIADWVKANPGASEAEILKASRDIVDSADNRFGEMIQDNIFWDKKLKQAAQLMVLSVGWDIGTAREVLGGMKDLSSYIAKGGELTPRAKYLIGAPIAHMLNASTYQYMKTGQGPQVPQDLVYPRTGGTTEESPGTKYAKKVPERLRLPSQMNDVISYQEDPVRELENKMAPVWKIVGDMVTNSDWRGDPISYQYMKDAPHGIKAYAEFIAKSLTPVSAANISKRTPGSNIGNLEKLSGSTPAGMRAIDPEGFRNMMKTKEEKREKAGIKYKENH